MSRPYLPMVNPHHSQISPAERDWVSARDVPQVPLPNPGEGGPVYPGESDPVPPLPDVGEGGPVFPGGSSQEGEPVIPLPNPGEGGPVFPGGMVPVRPLPPPRPTPVIPVFPISPRASRVRFLNAAFGYRPFQFIINNRPAVSMLSYGAVSAYTRLPAGYQTITVTGRDGYVFLRRTLPFQMGQASTVAVIRTPGGLDLLQIPDCGCRPNSRYTQFRVSNLAFRSPPLDVLLADGRVIYSDLRYKETSSYKRLRPGAYQFFFAQTDLTPESDTEDIETVDSGFMGDYPPVDVLASLYLEASGGDSCTVLLLNGPGGTLQTTLLSDRM